MSLTINELIIFILNNDMSNKYKKVFLKKIIKEYLNDKNENEIKDIIKNNNNEIYESLFLSYNDKLKNKSLDEYNKYIEIKKNYNEKYNEIHKEELKQKRRIYYQKHKEDKIKKVKEYQQRKKQEKLNNSLNE